ncbi:MAG: glycerol-3-phosphate 1-O-acyltransferase PlsY [Thermoleophilia bacterium]|nr:glycerol-3-phosphate 1-O-acyltransferase PlsY [Thermoleophilia bacterium]
MLTAIALVIFAYLLGSVPFALVIGKGIYGVDVRDQGSGNIGATNVFRVLGKRAGVLVFACDVLKGFIPVYLSLHLPASLTSNISTIENVQVMAVFVAGAAIAGHTFPIFLKFRGGKGVATGSGTILALMPLLFLVTFVVFWVVLIGTRTVSISSLTAVTGLCILVIGTDQPTPYIDFTFVGAAVIFYAHRSNIRRIRKGEENRVTFPWNRK